MQCKLLWIKASAKCININVKDAQLVLRGPKSVAEPEFYTWDGQGVAEANLGGPYTMTENQCITPTCQNKSYNF